MTPKKVVVLKDNHKAAKFLVFMWSFGPQERNGTAPYRNHFEAYLVRQSAQKSRISQDREYPKCPKTRVPYAQIQNM